MKNEMKLLVFVLILTILSPKVKTTTTENSFETMDFKYWQLKPFIYYKNNETLTGMIVEYYQNLKSQAQQCSHKPGYRAIDFAQFEEDPSHKDTIKQQLTDNLTNGYYFGPVFESWGTGNGEVDVDVEFVSESISLVSKMEDFHFYAKFISALYKLLPLMSLMFVAVCFVGMLFWLLVSVHFPLDYRY